MQTLQYPLGTSELASFDPLAVPAPFDPQPQLSAETQLPSNLSSNDVLLTTLGEEPLFQGTRNVSAIGENLPRPLLKSSAQETGVVVSEELHQSLGAARQAFLSALYDIFQQLSDVSPNSTGAIAPRKASTSQNSFASTSRLEGPLVGCTTPLSSLLDYLRSTASGFLGDIAPSASSLTPSVIPRGPGRSMDSMMETLSARVTDFSSELSGADAELACSLASLLVYIERLLVALSPPATRLVTGRSPLIIEAGEQASSNIYATLERETRALQGNGRDQYKSMDTQGGEYVTSAANAVELAESDYLWGQVDDFSERVGALCRARAQVVQSSVEEDQSGARSMHATTQRGEEDSKSFVSFNEPPQYSSNLICSLANLPPDYSPVSSAETRTRYPTASESSHPAEKEGRLSSEHSEKMQRDLDSVTAAIDRLYVVSPQLANQRVEPDRRQLRERQLTKLGNAIERLSSGRMNNQRAAAVAVGNQVEVQRMERQQRMEAVALDELIDRINRATSRTFTDQRVEIPGKRQEFLRKASLPTIASSIEAIEVERILEPSGKGRIASQDASFSTGPPNAPSASHSPRTCNPFASDDVTAVSLADFFKENDCHGLVPSPTPRTAAVIELPPTMKKKLSFMFQKNESSSRLSVFRSIISPTASRRGSYEDIQTEPSDEIPSTPPSSETVHCHLVDYIVEESRNLGSLTINFWPRTTTLPSVSYDILAIDALYVLVAPSSGGHSTKISLPSPVLADQSATIALRGTCYEIKLATASNDRSDVEIVSPLSTNELRQALPISFACSKCGVEIIDSTTITKYNALPSEHWAELLDSWMCHGDQELSQDLVEKGRGIKPRENEALVGSGYILFRNEHSKNWFPVNDVEPTRTDSDDLISPAICSTCQSNIGYNVTSPASTPSQTYFRLLKYASHPIESTTSDTVSRLRRYTLAPHLTASMLEIGRAHACHRFVVEDSETEEAKLLLWFFNPFVRISLSNSTSLTRLLSNERSKEIQSSTALSINAVKVLYRFVEKASDSNFQEFINSPDSTMERIDFPKHVIDDLKALLLASTAVSHEAKHEFGNLSVGFLERI